MTPRTRIATRTIAAKTIAARTITARNQEGVALLVTVFVLLLVGTVAIAAIGQSGQEAASSARTRAAMRALLAADAGVEVAIGHLAVSDESPFDVDIGGGIRVQSRTRDDASPQELTLASPGGPPPDEYGLPTAGGSTYGETGFFTDVFLINVTSSLPDGSVAQVEARLGRLSTGS
jgi:hypothetical protein